MFVVQDLIFRPNSFGELTARVTLRNISVRVVGYKMKTTTPDRYKVKPSSGALQPGDTLAMDVGVARSHAHNPQLIGQLSVELDKTFARFEILLAQNKFALL